MTEHVEPVHADRGIERLVFFSDAVFAIALTLLAIDLRLPATAEVTTSAQLIDALVAVGPQLYSFSLSFIVIILLWVGTTGRSASSPRWTGRRSS